MKLNKLNKQFTTFYNADTGEGGVATSTDPHANPATLTNPDTPKIQPSFSGTTIEKKDPVSGQTIKIPTELEPYLGHIISSTRKQIEGQYKPIIEKLEGDTIELGDIREELVKLKEATMTAEEIAQANATRKIAEHEAKMKNAITEKDTWKDRFQSTMINNDILSSFGDINLCNTEQTAILLRNEGKAEVVEVLGVDGKPTGDFQTRLHLSLVNEKTGEIELAEGTPKELFKRWVNQEHNLHHQVNNLTPGANSSSSNRKGIKGTDFMSMSPEERLRRARD